MRSKDLQAQSARALAVAEATLSLLQQRETETQTLSRTLEARLQQLEQRLSEQAKILKALEPYLREAFDQQFKLVVEQTRRTQEMLREQAEVLAIPRGDTPTVDELLEQAKSDPARRKLLETTLAELEFASPLIEFN